MNHGLRLLAGLLFAPSLVLQTVNNSFRSRLEPVRTDGVFTARHKLAVELKLRSRSETETTATIECVWKTDFADQRRSLANKSEKFVVHGEQEISITFAFRPNGSGTRD